MNCFLDPIFIFNLEMGVAGASLATAISKMVSFAILIFPYGADNGRPGGKLVALPDPVVPPGPPVEAGHRLKSRAKAVHGWVAVVNMLCAGLGRAKGALLLSTSRPASEIFPAILLSTMAETTASPDRNMEEEPTVMVWTRMSLSKWMQRWLFAQPLIGLFAQSDHAAEMREIGALCIRLQCLPLCPSSPSFTEQSLKRRPAERGRPRLSPSKAGRSAEGPGQG